MSGPRGVLLRAPLLALVLVGVAAGVAVAAIVAALTASRYRAESSLVVERGTRPATAPGLVRTIRDLGASDTIAAGVIRNLDLKESTDAFHKRVAVTQDDDSAVLLLRADAGDGDRAQSIVLQLGLLFTQLVHERFGQVSPSGGEPVQLSVLDQPHVLPGRVSPNEWRDLGWGALFGLVGGLFAANAFAARRPPKVAVETPPVLADVGRGDDFDAVAGRLLELARARPFQTVVVAGDANARVADGVAAALAARGVTSASVRSAETDPARLDALAARHAFVLVGAALDTSDAPATDAALAVTDGSPLTLELVLGLRGARLLGAVVAPGEGPA